MIAKIYRTKAEIEDIIFTLEICIKSLPADAHPAHYNRLNDLIQDLKRAKED